MKHKFVEKIGNYWKIFCPIKEGVFYSSCWERDGMTHDICPCCNQDVNAEILIESKGGDNTMGEQKEFVFGDEYPQEDFFVGEHLKVESILGKPLKIIAFINCKGDSGKFIGVNALLIEEENKEINFSISGVVEHQLKKAESDQKLPLLAKIIQKDSKSSDMKYYTLS